jgi:hypothetical protein
MRRHNLELMQVVRGILAQAAALPMEQAVPKLAAAAIKAHRIDHGVRGDWWIEPPHSV